MKLKFRTVKRNLNNDKVFYDPSFQRRVSWSQKDKDAFMESATKGWAKQPITLADVEKCLDYARERNDEISEDYFEELYSKGFKYVSIDGQNRTKFIIDFMNDKISISATLRDADGEEQYFKNVFMKTLKAKSPRTFDQVRDVEFTMKIYNEISRKDLANIFRSINSGNPLSAHGHRQSLSTPVAGWIRDLSSANNKMLSRVVDKDKIKDMADDELMAKVAMILMQKYACEGNSTETETKTWGLSKKEMDSWYKMGVDYYNFTDPGCPYLQSQTQRVEAIIRITSSLINNQKIFPDSKNVSKRFFIACLHLAEYVHDNNLLIDKYDKCATELYNFDEKLYSDAETDYSSARADAIKKGEDPKSISKYGYYNHWCQVPHQKDRREKRRIKLISEITKQQPSFTIRHKMKQKELAA